MTQIATYVIQRVELKFKRNRKFKQACITSVAVQTKHAKTSNADPQLAEIANMISELADKPASIPQDDTKETDFLAKLAMASRDTRNEISNLRAQTALIQ